jgi:hypothetical protein
MKEKIIKLSDIQNQKDLLSNYNILSDKATPKYTKIIAKDADTGEILSETMNKVVITGSVTAASKMFGISSPIKIPTYNTELELENSRDYTTVPINDNIVCLFCVDDSGCGTDKSDPFTVNYIDRISPETIMPFRYVSEDNDLNDDLRKYYFGRKNLNNGKIAYYFKKFETEPQMHLRYTDGTQITEEIYNVETDQLAECYVECKLKINRNDFRDYFEQVLGWDKARISSISLCCAWYDDTFDNLFKWYQDILPYTKLNFPYEELVSLDRAILFYYQIFY